MSIAAGFGSPQAIIKQLELENADLRRERNEFEQRLQELRKAHERLTEHCHDMAAQFETDQGIIKADGKEIHYLRQRVRELELELEANLQERVRMQHTINQYESGDKVSRHYACPDCSALKARVGELEAALEVADDGMGYAHRLLTEQSQRVLELEAQLKGREGWIPSVLFDGYAVLQGLSDAAKSRTSAENVSDVLDSAVKLIRAAAQKGE